MSDLDNWAIKSFTIVGNYTLDLVFADGKSRQINFEPVIGTGWMKPLLDIEYFNRVQLNDGGNLEWPDGQDFNPEALYNWEEFEHLYIEDKKNFS